MKRPSYAAHSYFHVINKADEKRRFLDEGKRNPQFAYRDHFDMAIVQGSMDEAEHASAKHSLQLVLASIDLQRENPDSAVMDKFRKQNEELFVRPRADYVQAILNRTEARVTPETKRLWQYVRGHIEYSPADLPDIIPDHVTFTKYYEYFDTYYSGGPDLSGNLAHKLGQALRYTGLAEKDWRVRLVDDYSHARIDHALKRVSVGAHYTPRTSKATNRIVVHEIYGHALRGPQADIAESEGVAVMIEQLLDHRFKFRRAYRYLGAALGWGSAGGPRTFREVYEILWRLMVIASRYNEENAKSYAFDECVRVFRGGRPDIAGMVFLKDAIYFAANIAVWQRLQSEPLAYNEFVDVIEGRRKVLS
jgi:hypothetical protein